jgi:CDP-4-dehydro-6-deoxyglucose reductase
VRVTVPKSGRSFSAEPAHSVLDAALRAGLNLPHSCKSGNCGSCRARLIEGRVRYPNGPPLGLSDAESADGLILLCQARAETDLAIETFEPALPEEVLIKRLPGRIERTLTLAHDVIAVYLKLPAAERFDFHPGQYVDVLLSRGRRRSFSIASPPHDSRLLELHVRLAPGGEFTGPLFAGRMAGALLDIEGPLGHFVYRPPPAHAAAAPMLLVGGGTGLAPLMSILRHVTEKGLAGPVHEAVLAEVTDLARHEVYASGPPAMIEAVRREFSARGVGSACLWFDSFDYAPDTLVRQRTTADTKS